MHAPRLDERHALGDQQRTTAAAGCELQFITSAQSIVQIDHMLEADVGGWHEHADRFDEGTKGSVYVLGAESGDTQVLVRGGVKDQPIGVSVFGSSIQLPLKRRAVLLLLAAKPSIGISPGHPIVVSQSEHYNLRIRSSISETVRQLPQRPTASSMSTAM